MRPEPVFSRFKAHFLFGVVCFAQPFALKAFCGGPFIFIYPAPLFYYAVISVLWFSDHLFNIILRRGARRSHDFTLRFSGFSENIAPHDKNCLLKILFVRVFNYNNMF
jgi:hypothetical protein